MAIDFKELREKMEKAGVNGGSQLHLRSEEAQTKKRLPRIPMLKNALKKKRLLLLETELAIPFNPETGKADEVFNSSNKYRPPISAETLALALKDMANENEALKNTLMANAGLTEWDTTPTEEMTEDDYKVFGRYRVPRIFSISAVHIDIPVMGTGQYGRDYAIDVKRDDNLEIVGETPLVLKVNKFFRDCAYEEVAAYREKIKNKEVADTEAQQKEEIRKIFGRVPVSDDKPNNFVFMYEIPIDNQGMVSDDVNLNTVTAEDLKEFEVLSRYKKGIRLAVESYMNGDWTKKFDKHFNFFEIEMSCPADGDDSTQQGKAKIGQDTKFEKPTVGLKSREDYEVEGAPGTFKTDKLVQAVREAIDSGLDIEQRVRRSMGIPMLDEAVENQLITSVQTVVDLEDNQFITDKVIKSNTEFLRLAFGEDGDEMIEMVEAGVSGREQGNLDEADAKAESKKYSLSDLEETEELEEFEEITLATSEV